MVKAIWNEVTLADSPEAVCVDGYYYFPRSSVRSKYLRASDRTTTCPHKGVAHYFDIAVGESVNANAAWCYPEPNPIAESIRDFVAFWKGVQIV